MYITYLRGACNTNRFQIYLINQTNKSFKTYSETIDGKTGRVTNLHNKGLFFFFFNFSIILVMVEVEKAPEIRGAMKLTRICQNQLIKNLNLINDVGTTPFHLIEPILKRKSAVALKNIESKSPHIQLHTDSLWEMLISKDFPEKPKRLLKKQKISQNNDNHGTDTDGSKNTHLSFREVYDVYYQERLRQENAAKDKLKQITKNLNYEKQKNKVIPINHIIVPATPPKKRNPYGTTTDSPATKFKSSLLQKAAIQNQARQRFFNINTNAAQLQRKIEVIPNKRSSSKRPDAIPSVIRPKTSTINKIDRQEVHSKINVSDLSRIRSIQKPVSPPVPVVPKRRLPETLRTKPVALVSTAATASVASQKKKIKLDQSLSRSNTANTEVNVNTNTTTTTSPTKKPNVYIYTNRN